MRLFSPFFEATSLDGVFALSVLAILKDFAKVDEMNIKRSALVVLSSILILLTWTSFCSSTVYAQSSKIYVLFIWGTEDSNVSKVTQTSKEKIEFLFMEMSKKHPGEFVMTRMDGERAHPENIIAECKKMAQQAGPNDALLVYSLCHGAVVKYEDGKWRHALAPLAKSGDALELESLGIKRGTIMKILKSSPHRLNMLITDSCSGAYPAEKEGRASLSSKPKSLSDYYLASILRKARGDLNINSTRPRTPGRPAELARGYAVRDLKPNETTTMLEREKSAFNKLNDRDLENLQYGGTVFSNVFVKIASRRDYKASDINLDSFFETLQEQQYAYYDEWIKYMISIGAAGSAINQETQTVTKYDDDSVPLLDAQNR